MSFVTLSVSRLPNEENSWLATTGRPPLATGRLLAVGVRIIARVRARTPARTRTLALYIFMARGQRYTEWLEGGGGEREGQLKCKCMEIRVEFQTDTR